MKLFSPKYCAFAVLVSIFTLLLPRLGQAQDMTVSGTVLDDDTGEPIPFANVYIPKTTIGVAADFDGIYSITFPAKLADSIAISALGYVTAKKKLGKDLEQKIDFRLKSDQFVLSEIVILAGENPANVIVRNIIKNKDRNSLSRYDVWQADMYSKTELDLDGLDPSMKNNKVMKPFDFIFDNVDSTSDVEPFLPAYMSERLSEIYFVRDAGELKDVPKAQRVSGVENQSVVEFIGSIQQDYNVYDNWITIIDKPFASPFSNTALANYEFYIMDSTMIKGRWSYKLKFKPKRKQENTFYGDFWVDMETFALEVVNMRMSPDVNINLIERVIIYAEFDIYNDSLWLPSKKKTVLDFYSVKKGPGIIGRRTASYEHYKIGDASTREKYLRVDPLMIDPESLKRSSEFWDTARHETLSKNEAAIYSMIDSIQSVPMFKTYTRLIYSLTTGYIAIGPVEVGPWFNLYSRNVVEGNRFRFGIGTSAKLSKKFWAYGYAAYGTKDKEFKYGGNAQYNFSKRPWTYIGAKYVNDIELSNENSEAVGEENIFSGFYRRKVPQKLLRVQEGKLYYEQGWPKGWSNRVVLLHRRMDPYEQYGFPFKFYPNPNDLTVQDSAIRTTEILFTTRYAYKERFLEGNFSRISMGSRYPIVEFQYAAGIKGILGSQFNYHKLTLSIYHWFNVPPFGWMKYNLKLGKIFGELPYLLMEVHPGNETYFYQDNAFNGLNKYEFASDMYFHFMFEHHLDGFLLNRIPLLRKLKWREVGSFKMVYGSLTDANKRINSVNNYDVNAPILPTDGVFYGTFNQGPYMEASVGIENIFKFIRVDALWRINYLQNRFAVPFTVRATLGFTF